MIDPALAAKIRLVAFDVDGVLTDGGIYLGDVGGTRLELKRYDIQDGLGVKFLQSAGIVTIIVTGRVSESVRLRGHELGIEHVIQDAHARKLPALIRLVERLGIALEDTAFVGDDFPDLGALRAVGLPVAVANAAPEIVRECRLQLTRAGGHGAVREFAELLLKARREWDAVVARYVAERDAELEEASS